MQSSTRDALRDAIRELLPIAQAGLERRPWLVWHQHNGNLEGNYVERVRPRLDWDRDVDWTAATASLNEALREDYPRLPCLIGTSMCGGTRIGAEEIARACIQALLNLDRGTIEDVEAAIADV